PCLYLIASLSPSPELISRRKPLNTNTYFFLFLRIFKTRPEFFFCKDLPEFLFLFPRHDPPGIINKAETGVQDTPPVFPLPLSDAYIQGFIFSSRKGTVSIGLIRVIGFLYHREYRIIFSLLLYSL